MAGIEAWQHIYTNVEKDQSPHNRGGFQTLFYSTDALSKEEVRAIEDRVLYIVSDEEPVKEVFFTTNTGKVVLGRVCSLPERDRVGR